MKATKKISILLPTRGRTELLKRSIQSLIDTVAVPTDIEIIFGIDQDDTVVSDYMKTEIAPMLQQAGIEAKANVFKPLGYENLHVYVNTLASSSSGEWLFFWNDDGVMITENWDQIIDSYAGQFKLLAPRDNHNGHPYAIFPIVPRDWFILMGHLSQNAQNDAWLSHIAYMLDIFQRIDVEFLHDRADLTGNNNDETFQKRKYQEGNPTDPNDFGHPDMQNARVATAHKLAWFMEKTGQDLSWWNAVLEGHQNPFEKMVWDKDVRGAGQLDALDQQQQIPDDQTIFL
jgi:hypothetical protein